ncbi:MAG: phosphoglycerate mutase family protein, partial [Odoribacter sp.]|nr:phosphoglycerate mutase family protein [Odoribacter sp.]
MNIEEISQQNQALAWQIIEDTNIIKIWESIGAKVNLVGSLKSGLMMKNKDIDLHIYT